MVLRVWFIRVGKAWWQKWEAAAHIASRIRKERDKFGAQLTFSFSSVWDPTPWNSAACSV